MSNRVLLDFLDPLEVMDYRVGLAFQDQLAQ